MKINPLTSVIIPTYNEENTISEAVKTLSEQTYKPLEILMVDDGSTDNTLRVISNFQFPISNFQLLKQNHAGPGKARNLGAQKAKGEILVFVDAD
ncbi:MAG TPA: glycosyltransferase family A protein, partial [Patescibacteria group bacterium]